MQLQPLHLCEISVLTSIVILSIHSRCNYAVNVALNQKATQFGGNSSGTWPASNAVDGDKNCTEQDVDRYHFSLTAYSNLSWWQVDLGGVYEVTSVVVYGRPSSPPVQLHGFYLLLSESNDGQSVRLNSPAVYSKKMEIKVNNITARYVKIEVPGTQSYKQVPVVLCEVEVNEELANLIPTIKDQVITSMTPTYMPVSQPNHPWKSRRAINGRYPVVGESPEHCDCCSGTAGVGGRSWWMLNLGMKYLIKNILAIGRRDSITNQLGDFSLYLSNSSTTPTEATYTTTDYESKYNIQVDNVLTQYITIKKTGFLTVCEFQLVEGDCPIGKYGDGCSRYCYCADGKECNRINGTCSPAGCKPGHQGPACEKVCDTSFYGANCNQTCGACQGGITCNAENGICRDGCLYSGVKPPVCKDVCDDGYYGYNCTNKCGHCLDATPCNKVIGNCSDCAAGYTGQNCNTRCEDGYFGIKCRNECGQCLDAHPCNKENGNCTDCAAGYTGPICKMSCYPGQYGPHCSFNCTGNCRNNQTCNITDGRCAEGCDRGYMGVLCNITCTDGYFGYNCDNICGNCKNSVTCDVVTGACSHGCSAGYIHANCTTACSSITFGENCKSTCLCINGESCTNDKGVCPGDCLPGYHGISCNKECTDNTFGINCLQKCGFCANNTQCKTYTGACPFGCIPPYIAPLCTEINVPSTTETSTGLIIGISAGVSSLFIVAAIVTIIITLKRRQAKKQNETNYTQPNMYIQPSEISEYDTIQLADVKEVPHVTPYENMDHKINTHS